MTISNTASSVTVLGNGTQTVFNYGFLIPKGSNFALYYEDANGAVSTLDPATYAVNGVGNSSGGTFEYPLNGGTPIAAGTSLTFSREVPEQQQTSFGNQGAYYPAVVESALDWVVMQIQDAQRRIGRSITGAPTDNSVPALPSAKARANTYLAFDSQGNPTASPGGSGTVPVSSVMSPVLAAAVLTAAQGKMGVPMVVSSVTALRALDASTAPGTLVYLSGYRAEGDGPDGLFYYDTSDTTTADNGGTVIVDNAGRRWHWLVPNRFEVTPERFGAVGDGATDDSGAFNSALAWLNAQGGGVLRLGARSYLVNSSVSCPYSNIQIEGQGSATIIVNGTTGAAALKVGDDTNPYNRVSVRRMAFAQAAGVTPVAPNCGLYCALISNLRVEDVTVFPYPSALYYGIQFNDCTQFYFNRLDVQSCLSDGIRQLGTKAADIYGADSHSDSNGGNGFYSDGSGGGYYSGVTCYGNGGSGWYLDDIVVVSKQYFMINCVGDTSGGDNWVIKSVQGGFFTNCWGSTQSSRTANTGAVGFHLQTGNVRNVTFVGGGAYWNNAAGVYVDTSTGAPARIKFLGFSFGTDDPASGGPNGHASNAPGLSVGTGADVQIVGGQSLGNTGGALSVPATGVTVLNLDGYKTESYGQQNVTTSATGTFSIPHGLAAVPSFINVTVRPGGATSWVVSATGADATNIYGVVYAGSTTINNTTVPVTWHAKV